MNIAPDLKYTRNDEWVRVEGSLGVSGITDYAQTALSDIVYVELPAVGAAFKQGTAWGSVESVKAASDVYLPVDGSITEVNEALKDSPEVVNGDPYGQGWMIKFQISDPAQLDGLMDADAYAKYCEERQH